MKLRMFLISILLSIPLLFFIVNLKVLELMVWIVKLLKPQSVIQNNRVKTYLRNQWLKQHKLLQLIQQILVNKL
jgi:hypothetical protein